MLKKLEISHLIEANQLLENIHGYIKEKDLTDKTKLILIDLEEELRGIIIISIYYERSELDYIIIKKKYQQKLVATHILNETVTILKEKKVENITLEVNVNNKKAISFYEKNDFKIVSVRKNYYKSEDAYLLERKI